MVSNPETCREKGSGQLGHVWWSELLYTLQCEFQTGCQTREQLSQLPASHFKSSCLTLSWSTVCRHSLYASFTLDIVVYVSSWGCCVIQMIRNVWHELWAVSSEICWFLWAFASRSVLCNSTCITQSQWMWFHSSDALFNYLLWDLFYPRGSSWRFSSSVTRINRYLWDATV